MGPIEICINDKLIDALAPVHLELVNESNSHSVPANSETHFKVLVVSDKFLGLSRVARGRMVHDVLKGELSGGVHALAQRLLTVEEFKSQGGKFESPPCYGGSKRG
jgi:stress-induced morphogen